MLLPQIDAESWAQRYGLPIKSSPCGSCGAVFEANVPFAVQGYRGLMTREHGCGESFVFSVAVPVGDSLRSLVKAIF